MKKKKISITKAKKKVHIIDLPRQAKLKGGDDIGITDVDTG